MRFKQGDLVMLVDGSPRTWWDLQKYVGEVVEVLAVRPESILVKFSNGESMSPYADRFELVDAPW